MPAVAPAWGYTASLAVLAARLRFIGCKRLGGLATGDSLAEGARLLGRKVARTADSRLTNSEGNMAGLVDELLNEVPLAAGPDGCGDAAELL
eukprot:13576526-Alexandrium_andersonii.AAC.1